MFLVSKKHSPTMKTTRILGLCALLVVAQTVSVQQSERVQRTGNRRRLIGPLVHLLTRALIGHVGPTATVTNQGFREIVRHIFSNKLTKKVTIGKAKELVEKISNRREKKKCLDYINLHMSFFDMNDHLSGEPTFRGIQKSETGFNKQVTRDVYLYSHAQNEDESFTQKEFITKGMVQGIIEGARREWYYLTVLFVDPSTKKVTDAVFLSNDFVLQAHYQGTKIDYYTLFPEFRGFHSSDRKRVAEPRYIHNSEIETKIFAALMYRLHLNTGHDMSGWTRRPGELVPIPSRRMSLRKRASTSSRKRSPSPEDLRRGPPKRRLLTMFERRIRRRAIQSQ